MLWDSWLNVPSQTQPAKVSDAQDVCVCVLLCVVGRERVRVTCHVNCDHSSRWPPGRAPARSISGPCVKCQYSVFFKRVGILWYSAKKSLTRDTHARIREASRHSSNEASIHPVHAWLFWVWHSMLSELFHYWVNSASAYSLIPWMKRINIKPFSVKMTQL